jgi:hypothetical protein
MQGPGAGRSESQEPPEFVLRNTESGRANYLVVYPETEEEGTVSDYLPTLLLDLAPRRFVQGARGIL